MDGGSGGQPAGAAFSSMDKLWTGISWVARVFAWIGGAMIMIAALVVSTEVICRKLFAFPFSGSDEIGAYLFAIGTSWSMAFVLVTRGHVRIDALYGGFSPKVRAVFDLVALVGLAVLVDRAHRPFLGAGLRQPLRLESLQHAAARPPALSAAAVVLRLRAVPAGLDDRLFARGDGVRCAVTTPRSRPPRESRRRTRRSRASSKVSASSPSRWRKA